MTRERTIAVVCTECPTEHRRMGVTCSAECARKRATRMQREARALHREDAGGKAPQ